MPATTISIEEFACLVNANSANANSYIELIDVRTPAEFREIHATTASNVPLETLDPHAVMQNRNGNSGETLYVICRSGARAGQACQKFLDAGFENVLNVEGGTLAWDKAGHAVVRGKKAISLERQVRITAGVLVLVGAALGFLVHPYWIGLSGFVGAGLMFSGITDACPMAMVIARMPWNQVCDSSPNCCSPNAS